MGVEKFWDERYSGDEFVYGVEPNSFLRDHAEILPSCGRVLCLSEGEGRNAVFLAGQGFDVHAVDFSTVARDKAFSLAALRKVSISYDVADLADYNLGEESGTPSCRFLHIPILTRVLWCGRGLYLLLKGAACFSLNPIIRSK